jgi:predicted dehydrogenase
MVRIGILGTAAIARAFFGTPLQHAVFDAVASRSHAKAVEFARNHGIPRAYGSYEDLLADRAIDAVYIPLPQFLHCTYTEKAAAAGKHVLVEKPAAPTVAEVERMIAACRHHGVVFMEAFMYRFKTIHHRVRDLVTAGSFGPIRYVDFNWCFNIHALRRSAFRLDPAAGGGALNDLGIYGVDFLRFLGLPEPEVVHAHVTRDQADGVDMFAHVTLTAGSTLMALTSGFTCDANYYALAGERGSAFVPGSLSGRMVANTLTTHFFAKDTRQVENFPVENPYAAEVEHFAQCILHGTAPDPGGEGSLANIRVLEAIRQAAGMKG